MAELARLGVTHIIDMQIEFDDRPLAKRHGISVLYNPTDDDFQPKPARLFQKGVDYALAALEQPEAKVYVHCAAGVHRAPMMTLNPSFQSVKHNFVLEYFVNRPPLMNAFFTLET